MIDISTSDLDGQTLLKDRDKIRLEVTQNVTGADQIEIGLQLSEVAWWKGVQLEHIVLAQCQDNQPAAWARLSYAQFTALELHLWKAKGFGAHTAMYRITDAATALKAGNRYTFVWLLDH